MIMFDRLKNISMTINLRGLTFIAFCLFNLSLLYGQTTFPTNRYYQVIVNDAKVSQHLTQLKAEQVLNCRSGYIIPPTGKTLEPALVYCPPPPKPPSPPCPEMQVDTIFRIVHTYGGVVSPKQVVLDDCREIYITEKLETVGMIQDPEYMVALQRIRSFNTANTSYRLLGQKQMYSDQVDALVKEITSTKAVIEIHYKADSPEETVIEYYGPDNVIKQTSRGASNITSLELLNPKTVYHFRVYGLSNNRTTITSILYNFTTL